MFNERRSVSVYYALIKTNPLAHSLGPELFGGVEGGGAAAQHALAFLAGVDAVLVVGDGRGAGHADQAEEKRDELEGWN